MPLLRFLSTVIRRTYRSTHSFTSPRGPICNTFANSISGKPRILYQNGYGHQLWMILPILGFCGNIVMAEDSNDESGNSELERVEDGSVVSNIHTSKWRVFTDSGREYFFKGKFEPAERLFSSAIEEAKEGFGERDPHVASACNNLAELYRVKKEFEKAMPLYLEAVSILEEYYGPEDVRVGATLHNLGQFYLIQRKLEEAQGCYERALKMKRRVLGNNHPDYAETMYHLGTVLHLQGKDTDAEVLILDSLKILEEVGQGESMTYIRRLRYLSQVYLRANRLVEAENIQRKLLHMIELSKGLNSMEAVTAAEALARTLQLSGQLTEALEIFEKCLSTQKNLLPEGHIQIAGNFLHIAKTLILQANQLKSTDNTEALSKLEKAKNYLEKSTRMAKEVLLKLQNQKNKDSGILRNYEHAALVILMQSLESLATLEMSTNEDSLLQCVAVYKEFGNATNLQDSPEVKSEYLKCLKSLSTLLAKKETAESTISLAEMKEEVSQIEKDLSHKGKSF